MPNTTRSDTTSLSGLLRTATRAPHEAAEGSGFVRALMSGRLSVAAYIDLATQHHSIYTALEAAGRRLHDDPIAGPLVFAELARAQSLEADLRELVGPHWQREVRLYPSTTRYVRRLSAACNRPGGYLAHAYTRYLGDLSGGQIVHRSLREHYGLDDAALSFYRFTGIKKIKPFRDRYRIGLDAAPLTDSEKREVAAEAVVAFELNVALFADLGAAHPA